MNLNSFILTTKAMLIMTAIATAADVNRMKITSQELPVELRDQCDRGHFRGSKNLTWGEMDSSMRQIIINQINTNGFRLDSNTEYIGAKLHKFKESEWVYMFCFEEDVSPYKIRFPIHVTWNSEIVRRNLTPTKSELVASMPLFESTKYSILRIDNDSGSCSMSVRFDRNKSGFYFVTSCDHWANDDIEDGTRFYKEYSVMPFGLLNMKILEIQRGWQ